MEGKSFYKNVFLLTQMVPPSKEFKKYFKEVNVTTLKIQPIINTIRQLSQRDKLVAIFIIV